MGKSQIGAIIKLDGEASFKASIQNCKSSISAMKAELKTIQANYKGNANSLEALTEMQNKYSEIQKTAAAQVERMSQAYEESKQAENRAKDAMLEMLDAYEQASKELKDMQESGTASAEALAEQSKKADEAQAMYDAYAAQVEKAETRTNRFKRALADAKTEEQESKDAVKQYAAYIEEAKNSADGAAHSLDEYGQAVKETGNAAGSAGSAIDTMRGVLGANFATSALSVVVDKLREAASYAVEVGKEFEGAMSKVEALSGATGADLEALKDKAAELGRNTSFSASEVAEAFSYMALAGWDTEQMLASISGVLDLAKSSEMSLGEASDIVTDYISAFGLSARDTGHFVDVMATAMSKSNINTSQLGEAYKDVATTAGQFGYSVEETTAALMTMANVGIKSEAGNTLNTLMVRLATNTKNCADELKKYGVNIYDNNGNMKSLTSILTGIAEAMSKLTTEEQANLAKMIAGQNQYTGFLSVMQGLGDAAKQNGQSFEDYTEKLKNCDNTAQNMADTMSNNLEGDMKGLESATEGLGDAAYEYIKGPIRGVVQAVTDAINDTTDAISPQVTEITRYADSVISETQRIQDSMDAADAKSASGLDNYNEMLKYLDIIDSAREKQSLTEYETYQLNTAIKALSGSIPELNDYIDDTGRLLGLSDDEFKNLRKIMTTEYSQVLAQVIIERRNAYQQLMADSEIAMREAQSAYAEVSQEQGETLRENLPTPMDWLKYKAGDKLGWYEKLFHGLAAGDKIRKTKKAFDDATESYEAAKKQLGEYEKMFPELADTLGVVQDENGQWIVSMDEAADAAEEDADRTTSAIGEVSDATDEMTDTVRDAVNTYNEKMDEMAAADPSDRIRDNLAAAAAEVQDFKTQMQSNLSSFSLFGDRSSLVEAYTTTNRDEMERNMSWALGSMRNYTQELDLLQKRGVSSDFINYLMSQGQAGLNYVHSLALASDAELKQFQSAFDEYNSYVHGANDNVRQLMTDYTEGIMSGVPDGYDAWHQFGIETIQGLFDAIQEATAAIANGSISGDINEAMQVILQNNYNQRNQIDTSHGAAGGMIQSLQNRVDAAKANVNNFLDRIKINVETHNYIDSDEVSMATTKRIREYNKITGSRR